jgi:ADP-ribose pyrophosphatase YjhB (NUDIX family)
MSDHDHTPISNSAPAHIIYCPRCASELITQPIGDKLRRVCPSCDFIYFTDPKVGVGVLILDGEKILLVKRGMNPEKGKWSIPAGFLDHGEDPKITAAREVLEETNLRVEIRELLDVYYNPGALSEGGASIFILYAARIIKGVIRAGDDAEAVGFFGRDNLPELAFASTRDVIRRWQERELR